ncbi:hypothetical protein [Levilactobacillus brevis]|uniref:hypothetical protein n=1 Tax=Levilactobacillus brevis TaxID=1580 RepID=UPI001F3A6500|nr:hypothetical protein [Levilactobacillus brevis]MCE6010456.1 hypothetical protein [Levilactobacillus brevis]MCE6025018.1 hypothetical protein [Levilactobacillus brevis]MCE6035882.1 hypothetical protein [Levilactobacillus brevis]
MATPNVGILTTTGKALIDKVNSGQAKISFSKVVFSSMDNSQLSDTQIKALTAIAPQEVVVSSPQTTLDTNSGETRIRATGTNEKLADGVYVKTYGVFAKDDTGNEILYGVTVSPNPNYFPAYDGVTPQAVTYSYKTVIQETSNITMTNSNDVYVSQEDLTEAIAKIPQPDLSGYDKTDDVDKKLQNKQDKLGFTAASDSTVVHTADMRKPASDVAGIEEVSTLQTQVNNSAVGTNLLLGTSNVLTTVTNVTGWRTGLPTYYPAEALKANQTYTMSCYLEPAEHDAAIYMYTAKGNIRGTTIAAGSKGISTLTMTLTPEDAEAANGAFISFTSSQKDASAVSYKGFKLEKGSVATDWCPNPDDKVNVSDMRKPASDVAGIEEVNAKQDKLTITPADDSKVAHLSGANNFDTVPTVNNNPLLLASSLPFDLARTSQQTNFTAGLQSNGTPVATKSDVTTAISTATANMVDSTKATNFTAGLRSGGVDVATAADLKSVKDSAWRVLDNKYITAFTKYNTSIKVDDDSLLLVKIDKVNKRVYMFFTILGNFVEDSRLYIDLTSIVKNVSFPDDANYELYAVGQSAIEEGSIAGNRICFKIRIYDTTYVSSNHSSYTVNTNKAGWTYSLCFVNYDELV